MQKETEHGRESTIQLDFGHSRRALPLPMAAGVTSNRTTKNDGVFCRKSWELTVRGAEETQGRKHHNF